MRYIAVDWSGSKDERGQLTGIWLAEAESGSLVRLRNGLTRKEAIAMLVKEIASGDAVIIGLDFAFSFPKWYLKWRKLGSVRDLWDLAAKEGEKWLGSDTWPFWGRSGEYQRRPENLKVHCQFRQTERDHKRSQPKSVFQVSGVGAVGTGTIRGLPALVELQEAGAAIWPFDDPETGRANVVEIFPRLFYGTAVTKVMSVRGRDSRKNYLATSYAHVARHWRDVMIGSPDAFDAGVSALVMSACAADFHSLKRPTEAQMLLEGKIWLPS